MTKWKKLSKDERRDRMNEALNHGGCMLRAFVSDLAKEHDVPEVGFSFWLLQQECYVDFETAEFTVKEKS